MGYALVEGAAQARAEGGKGVLAAGGEEPRVVSVKVEESRHEVQEGSRNVQMGRGRCNFGGWLAGSSRRAAKGAPAAWSATGRLQGVIWGRSR